ncbi:MAG TPA: LysM peptidoglycan-binding domain-containing protein [Chryseosolibacter sp.]|nr:LysM peptidoglycan-binding domain-containing protein [Chryseosolibacter sp.]
MIKLLIIGFSIFSSPVPQDSVGVETINGKLFVVHRVDEKETLFAISRRYGTPVAEIVQYNAGADKRLDIGQIIKVPYTPKQKVTVAKGTTHTVQAKETLFSIAKMYGASTSEIKQWNNISDDNLSIGQVLVVKKKPATSDPVKEKKVINAKEKTHTVAEKETMYAITRQYGISIEQLREWNNLSGNELQVGQLLIVSAPGVQKETTIEQPVNTASTAKESITQVTNPTTVTEPVKTISQPGKDTLVKETPKETIKISESVRSGDEVVESGVAELIEGTEGNRKYLALHRTAPVGTILKVRNEMNNREVFVRVMGKLPETAFTEKVVIRVSKSAYDRLGAIDPKFRVEVTYYK